MDAKIEIRRLLPSHLKELSSRLEDNECWKHLMKIIPSKLDPNDFKCDIGTQNQYKYQAEHFRLIERHSVKSKRTCTEILFDEWGTSGRIRPTLGHLLYLLIKAKLYKAADYVAVELLHQPKPQRPKSGPEAAITVDLEKIMKLQEDDKKQLNNAASLVNQVSSKIINVVPEIVVTPDADVFCSPVVPQRGVNGQDGVGLVSDMIEFSGVEESQRLNSDMMQFSEVEVDKEHERSPSDIMKFSTESETSFSTTGSITDTYTSEETNSFSSIPALSLVMGSDKSNDPLTMNADYIPAFGEIANSVPNIPHLSVLNLGQSTQSNSKSLEDTNSCMPDLEALQNDSIESNNTASRTLNVSSQISPSKPCSSPLPALSLVTELPHISYSNLIVATNDFNEEPYKNKNAPGRFLGSGEFGRVFLALNLMDKPVAVRRLSLGGLEVVDEDDKVTVQFRNEVEVLSKYSHQNLVKLLGFSCDGSTYCLLYEFVPGGALRDRLQIDESLQWKQRLNIAVGTSKAIAYLHTAFSSPLIHRDVKSANILLDANNNSKLCDFGLIKLIPNQNVQVATSVIGTSAYMPREAFAGDISVKLDTFSFGVVLLELITSLPPLDANGEGSDLVTHIQETVDDDDILPLVDFGAGIWSEKGVNYAQSLYTIAMKCLAEKKKRPTMVEVKMNLDELTKNIDII